MKEYRWVINKCTECGKPYADHEWWSISSVAWHSRSANRCAGCLMEQDMRQRSDAVNAARRKWLLRMYNENLRTKQLQQKNKETNDV